MDCLIATRDERRQRKEKHKLRTMLTKKQKPWKPLDLTTRNWMRKYTAKHQETKTR